jgi:hypothetical protein
MLPRWVWCWTPQNQSLRNSYGSYKLVHPGEFLQASWCARGDVGSWVREAAMSGLTAVLPIFVAVAPNIADGHVACATATLAKQAVERIARMRQVSIGMMS